MVAVPRPNSLSALAAWLCVWLGAVGCGGSSSGAKPPTTGAASACGAITARLASFGEVLETTSISAKGRVTSYAGLLELLLNFEGAATELDRDLTAMGAKDSSLEPRLRETHGALDRAAKFAVVERESIEKRARALAPLAKETQQAWMVLRSTCEGKKGPPECGGVRDALAKFDAAESHSDHDKAVSDLLGLKLTTPALAKSRDRAVAASKAVQAATKTQAEQATPMPKRWTELQRDLDKAIDGLLTQCKGAPPEVAPPLVSAKSPDPRKLTVLVHVKPPAGVERSLLSLALSSHDADEREFYKARAEGAFGSGFFILRKTDKGSELLVVTNRHVVELGDRATLELADGTALGPADILYSSPTYDLAVLRPVGKLSQITEGFSFSKTHAKDQQTVIATGFPGIVGRPSYQTTRGYVSNESFRLDDGARPIYYVQHTAPIDPGSSGGPLTDEAGDVLGVNTLKVTGREAVGLAVPSRYVVDTLRVASGVEARYSSKDVRKREARLACLAFLGEIASSDPRMLVLEQMISNRLTGAEGLDAASALAGEEGFEHLWNMDSVRAMRIAVLVKLRAHLALGGGPSVLETCDDSQLERPDLVKFHIRLSTFEPRDLGVRFEHGRFKIDGIAMATAPSRRPSTLVKKLPPAGPTTARPPKKGVAVPKSPR